MAVRPYSVPFILGIILVNLCRKIVPSKEDSDILKYGSQAIINLDSKLPNYELLGTIKFYFHNGNLAIYKPLDTCNWLAIRPYYFSFLGIMSCQWIEEQWKTTLVLLLEGDAEVLENDSQTIINVDFETLSQQLQVTFKFYFLNGSLAIYTL